MPTPPKPAPQPQPDPSDEIPGLEAHQAWRAFAYLLTGPLVYGGLGWLLDNWFGTEFLLPVGIVGGMGLSLYLIWFRYGTH
jgi:F0F1-type ATP synthase assembly protein I